MEFTQAQARNMTGISEETFRHWRKVVPYLRGKSGKSARFSFFDLFGLLVTREMVTTLGASIADIGGGVDHLFRLLADVRWNSLERATAILDHERAVLLGPEEFAMAQRLTPAIMVPCGPLVQRIRAELSPDNERDLQHPLPFPPQALRSA